MQNTEQEPIQQDLIRKVHSVELATLLGSCSNYPPKNHYPEHIVPEIMNPKLQLRSVRIPISQDAVSIGTEAPTVRAIFEPQHLPDDLFESVQTHRAAFRGKPEYYQKFKALHHLSIRVNNLLLHPIVYNYNNAVLFSVDAHLYGNIKPERDSVINRSLDNIHRYHGESSTNQLTAISLNFEGDKLKFIDIGGYSNDLAKAKKQAQRLCRELGRNLNSVGLINTYRSYQSNEIKDPTSNTGTYHLTWRIEIVD